MTTPPKGNLPPRRPLTHSPYVAITNRERIRPSKIFFTSNQKGNFGLYRKSASGTGQDMSVFQAGAYTVSPTDVSFDGKNLLYTANQGGNHIFVLPLEGDRKAAPFMPAVEQGNHAKFSPDGRWVVYQSNESGRGEIYVRPFPSNAGGGGKWAISNTGGSEPRWRRDGKDILYLAMNGMVTAVDVTTNGTLRPGAVHPRNASDCSRRRLLGPPRSLRPPAAYSSSTSKGGLDQQTPKLRPEYSLNSHPGVSQSR